MGEYFTPIKFWFCKDSTIPLAPESIINELNNNLLKNNVEKYNEGYRYIDVGKYDFSHNNQRYQLDTNGKIIFEFASVSDLVFFKN